MTGQIRFKVLMDIELTLVYYQGIISLPILKEHLQNLGSHEAYDPTFNTISDFDNCVFDVNNNIIQQAADFIRRDKPTLGSRKNALIFRDAKQQSIISLYSLVVGDTPIKYNVVSNFREAAEFIELDPIHYPLVKKTLKELAGDIEKSAS